jgi:hyperosmotically inducible periplasmic protein
MGAREAKREQGELNMNINSLRLQERKTGRLIRRVQQFAGRSLAIGLVALATSCASDRPQRTAGQSIDDQATARRVEQALSSDPAYKFTEVKVVAYQGKVQLSGFVDKDEQKGQAEEIAKKTPGVKEVKNDIARK